MSSREEFAFQWRALLAAMLVASAIISPFFFRGNASGHDFQFHMASWMDAAWQWHQGVLYPRWAAWANFSYGEPRFIFYPPASWMLGAALGSVLPWRIAPGALIWLALVTAGICMYRLAREWMAPSDAIAAAALYTANPYHLVLVYYRSDFAELLVSAVFPLLVLFALRIGRAGPRVIAPLAVVFAFAWFSNAPAAVIATYSLVLLLAVLCVIERSPRPLLWGSLAMAAGFGLAAIYIVPAAWEQKWVQIHQVLARELRPQQNFLFTHANDPEFVLFNWKVSTAAVAVMLVTWIAMVISNPRRRSAPEAWWPLAPLCAASTVLMFPISGVAWRLLPELRFVQFPWRWLVPLDAAFAAFVVMASARLHKRWIGWAVVGLALAAAATVIVRDAWWDSEDAVVLSAAMRSGHGYEGTDEYQPLGCDRYELPENASRVALARATLPGEAQHNPRIHVEQWGAERKTLEVDSSRPITLVVKLLNYPAWHAEVNGKAVRLQAKPDSGQILLSLPAGHSRADIIFAQTPDRKVGAAISVVSLFALAGLVLFERRRGLQAGAHASRS